MTPTNELAREPETPPPAELDDFVKAFEAAQARDGQADLATFLPAADSPLYRSVLRELIRVDLEFAWTRGRPRRVEEYLRRFPELFLDRQGLQEIAFEEFRLRRRAGEDPTTSDYQRRFGLSRLPRPSPEGDGASRKANGRFGSRFGGAEVDWREDLLAGILEAPPEAGLEGAARAYQDLRRKYTLDDLTVMESEGKALPATKVQEVGLFLHLHRTDPKLALEAAETLTEFPAVGTDFLGFHLLGELGRGAFGRVYLARQGDLADRHVALKVTAQLLEEPQVLAQLQHTNIVPVYSVHRAGHVQAVCMPYFGSTTLADVFQELQSARTLPASGKGLLSTIHARKSATRPNPEAPASAPTTGVPPSAAANGLAGAGAPAPATGTSLATLRRLEGLSYVDAVLWLAWRLADALAHAHERGILHRDLKPANVLLTDEGEPMLLDFNLSEDTKRAGAASRAMVGGSLPYMAPEHLEAFLGAPRDVDARSDLYSLGVILFELLTGRHSFPVHSGPLGEVIDRMFADRRQPPPRVRCWNPAVSPAVEAIVRRCLEPHPARRYQSAEELREDLDRQLHHLPLEHTPEPSLREKVQKWFRRHPRAPFVGGAVAAALALVVVGSVVGYRWNQAQQRLAQTEAMQTLEGLEDGTKAVQSLLATRDTAAEPAVRKRLEEGMAFGKSLLDRYQVLDDPSWNKRPAVANLPEPEQERLRKGIAELAALLAQVQESPAKPQGPPVKPVADTRQLRDLEKVNPLSEAAQLRLRARDYLRQGRYVEAAPLLDQANRAEPLNYWGWFLLANYYHGLAQNAKAEFCYGICIALWPRSYAAHYHLGLVHIRQNDYRRAVKDFDKAIEIEPERTEAYIDRSIAREALKQYKGAVEDLTKAIEHGDTSPRVYFMRARARAFAGDHEGAKRDEEEGLRRQPGDELSWVARGWARMNRNPKAALADFDEALKINPRSFQALQNKAHILTEKLGQTKEGVEVLNRIIAQFPDYVPARGGRGALLARLGKREAALQDARETLMRDTSPFRLYQVASIYALTSKQNPQDRSEALRFLALALQRGQDVDVVDKDPDLEPIRNQPEYRRMIEAARALHTAAKPPK